MDYNGSRNCLKMIATAGGQSITTRYTLDAGRVLAAASADNSTFYLYGMGLIGELTDNWSYSLPDGSNTARQLTNQTGGVTLVTSYTPLSREGMLREGDLLDVRGEGSFTYGYFGGVTLAHARRAGVDNATGLMYIGNGQYYDPGTGRFLNRSARPQQTNPYVPWSGDPAGMFVAPLSLLGLLLGKKKKRGKWELFAVILVLGLSLGMSLTACQPPNSPPPPTETQEPGQPINNDGEEGGGRNQGTLPNEPEGPTQTPTFCITITPTSTSTPTPIENAFKRKMTEWEKTYGKNIANAAENIYTNSDKYYVWGMPEKTDEDNTWAPPRVVPVEGVSWGYNNSINLKVRTGGRIPVVCADVVFFAYQDGGDKFN